MNIAFLQITFCLLLVSNVFAQSTMFKVPVSTCNAVGTTGKLVEVRLSNCNQLPCILRKGTTATIEFDYIPGVRTTSVITGAFGIIGGIPLPFIGTNGRPACSKIVSKKMGTITPSCEQIPGEVYTYTNSFSILNYYPSTNVKVQWELIDGITRQRIVCWTLPSKIL